MRFRAPPPVVDAVDRKIANEMVGELSPSDQRRWIVALTRWQQGVPVPEFPSTAESLRDVLEDFETTEEPRRNAWSQMLDALSDRVATQPSDGSSVDPAVARPSDAQNVLVTALLKALDDAADARVVDGSVWRSGDFDAFYRYLDQSSEFTPTGLAATGVLPLLQQPGCFSGTTRSGTRNGGPGRVDGGIGKRLRD